MKQQQKPPNTIRIFCLGASTTDQATQSNEDTWCDILGEELNQSINGSGYRIETAAYGRGGWKAIDLYLWASKELEKYNPDIVVTLMGINDLSWNGGPDYSYTGLKEKIEKKTRNSKQQNIESQGQLAFVCKEYSQLCRRFVLVKKRFDTWMKKQSGDILEWHSENLPKLRAQYQTYPFIKNPIRQPDPITEFSDAMDALISDLKDAKISTIVLGQPVLWKRSMSEAETDVLWFSVNTPKGPVKPSSEWLFSEMRRYNEAQKTIASKYGASYIELDSQIPKTLKYYFDDCHFTDLGSRELAINIKLTINDHIKAIINQ